MTELKNKTVTCRKPHRCSWCGEPIKTGDKAVSRACIFESDFQSSYEHPECIDAMNNSDIDYDEGYEFMAYIRGKTMYETEEIRNKSEC